MDNCIAPVIERVEVLFPRERTGVVGLQVFPKTRHESTKISAEARGLRVAAIDLAAARQLQLQKR